MHQQPDRPGPSPDPGSRILYEDNHLIVVNKLPSEIIQADPGGDEPLCDKVARYIGEKYHKPGKVFLGVIHRIDRPASGAVMFARTGKALARMNELVRNRSVTKIYWAVVKNLPDSPQARLLHYLRRDAEKNKTVARDHDFRGAQPAELSYRLLASGDRYHLLEVELITGRHHQIRVQLARIGCPIRGDVKYGFPRTNPDGSIHLHARSLAFMHPVKEVPVAITAPPPDEVLWNFFASPQP